ncbi:hypothetical protein [Paenibacillus sp. FSL H3-0333]|uniref:hypothetical protein n=1 Tax=Paenibacillus sp. FSL H3-0333 TaxID=2921373 RepID=UPI0030FC5A33
MSLINENQLDEWVRGNTREAQGKIVELVWRLVAVSSPNPKERRFPLGDSIGQPGPDGLLNTEYSFDPFVPEGRSFWEIGTGYNARDKATSDYHGLTDATPEEVRKESTFVFVTPLSGRRDWQHTWKENAQAEWLHSRRQNNEWADVRVIDGSVLIDWLHHFPAVETWLAEIMNLPIQYIQTAEQHWGDLKTIGDPPPLTPEVFLTNRNGASDKLNELFSGTLFQLKVDTLFPEQVADFVAAHVASLDEESKVDIAGRCLIISNVEAWNAMVSLKTPHFLVANFDLDETETSTKLLERARRGRHLVIFSGRPGGIPHPNRVTIPNPKSYQLKEALVKAGYNEERARTLAQKSDGNLSSLLRCIQHLSLMAEWAQRTDAAELVIAELLGAWNERSDADKSIVEKLSGNLYGDWIGKIRDISLRSNSPLINREGNWKFVLRYEGWYALGPRIYDELLDRFKEIALTVLKERDPQFDLPGDQRYAASIYGKDLNHSKLIRKGIAETLALLGSQAQALISCSSAKAVMTASTTIRELFFGADWILWASLNDLLPLFAEAAPNEFLGSVEEALANEYSPFESVFSQEGTGLMGHNYMTGLLWALETLAWDAEYLTRVVMILGELAQKDPGGNWANRPANSLSTILLPWLPQTSASVSKRKVAVSTLFLEFPDVAWKLLLELLPSSHQVSSGSHKPSWRELISDDWTKGVTNQEYWEQISGYARLLIEASKHDLSKLNELISRFSDLPQPVGDELLSYLSSPEVLCLPQEARFKIWNELTVLILRHRKFSDAKWSIPSKMVDNIQTVADSLSPVDPFYRNQRIFNDYDSHLFEELGNYQEQQRKLDELRQNAVKEILVSGGVEELLNFAKVVEHPMYVGLASGVLGEEDVIEKAILPELIISNMDSLSRFVGGFILGAFRKHGWQWIDNLDFSNWSKPQIAQLLVYLPFSSETWGRLENLLGEDQILYWSLTNANPYETEEQLDWAIDCLLQYNRPHAAVKCLDKLLHDKGTIDSQQAVRVLRAVLASPKGIQSIDAHDIVEIIKALQNEEKINQDELAQIEWNYLTLLRHYPDAKPKILEQQLAEQPTFFCQVIRTVFRSKNEEQQIEDDSSEDKKNIASNAYNLLREWSKPPGSREGTFDGDFLINWLEEVKKLSHESGHLEVALTMVGHVLIYTPADPDGLWIHHSAAKVLNEKDAKDMREGYRTELYNSRGVHSWTAGKEEKELAEKYRKQAEEVELHGYHRLADVLRQLASSYEYESQLQASEDLFED